MGADPWDCPGCRAIHQEQENVHEKDRGPWWKFGLVPRAVAEAAERAEMNGASR